MIALVESEEEDIHVSSAEEMGKSIREAPDLSH